MGDVADAIEKVRDGLDDLDTTPLRDVIDQIAEAVKELDGLASNVDGLEDRVEDLKRQLEEVD